MNSIIGILWMTAVGAMLILTVLLFPPGARWAGTIMDIVFMIPILAVMFMVGINNG